MLYLDNYWKQLKRKNKQTTPWRGPHLSQIAQIQGLSMIIVK